jgi:hypothetical protein
LRFGGSRGCALKIKAGDVAILPAGTGHKRIDEDEDLLVVSERGPRPSGCLATGRASSIRNRGESSVGLDRTVSVLRQSETQKKCPAGAGRYPRPSLLIACRPNVPCLG